MTNEFGFMVGLVVAIVAAIAAAIFQCTPLILVAIISLLYGVGQALKKD